MTRAASHPPSLTHWRNCSQWGYTYSSCTNYGELGLYYSGSMQYGNCYNWGRTDHYDYSHCSGCSYASIFCGTSGSSATSFTNSEVEVWYHHS